MASDRGGSRNSTDTPIPLGRLENHRPGVKPGLGSGGNSPPDPSAPATRRAIPKPAASDFPRSRNSAQSVGDPTKAKIPSRRVENVIRFSSVSLLWIRIPSVV